MLARFNTILLVLWTATTMAASDHEMQDALKDCSKTQLTMTLCAQHKAEIAEKRLNEVYQCVLRDLKDSPDWVKSIRETQRAWIKYRKGQCTHFAGGPPGPGSGSMWP